MTKLEFYPLDISYKVVDSKAWVYLYGRTVDGRQICVIDKSFKPYFYVVPKQGVELKEKIKKLELDYKNEHFFVTDVEGDLKNIIGKKTDVLKIYVNLPKGVPLIKDIVKDWDDIEAVYEYDIKYVRRYLISKAITPLSLVQVEGEVISGKSKVPLFEASTISSSSGSVKDMKILAVDIETYNPGGKRSNPDKDPIIMIGLYSEGFEKVITWKEFRTDEEYIDFVKSEAELLEKFKEAVEDFRPDVITGYFSDSFDIPYIIKRARKYKVDMDLGVDYSEPKMTGRGMIETGITGIVHLDIFQFIRRVISRSLKTDSYTLSAVSEELLGEKKIDADIEKLVSVWDKGGQELENYCRYNLKDAQLTYELCLKLMPNISELVKIIGLPIFEITRMSFSQLVEWFIIKQANNFNEMILTKPHFSQTEDRIKRTYQAAFVYEPKPGLYENIVVFDFRSLYPTIIVSYNVSPDTMNCSCCEEKQKAPLEDKNIWFCTKKKGFLPSIIEDLITRRMRIKEMMKQSRTDPLLYARSWALKDLSNAFSGYLGFYAARWYSIECIESVTAWGRYHINKLIEGAKEKEFGILYGDSLPYERKIFVQKPNSEIILTQIGKFVEENINNKQIDKYKTLAFDKGRVVFKPIKQVIKHYYDSKIKGDLLEFTTTHGKTIVTPQHSIYTFKNKIKLTDAGSLKIGDSLISLTNPKLEEKFKENHILDMLSLDLGEYKDELRVYEDNLIFPAKRDKCPYCNKERLLSSHVSSYHKDRKLSLNDAKKTNFLWIGGVGAGAGRIPRYWKLTKELAWILGYYCADGSVSDVATKTGRKRLLSFGSQNLSVIEKVKKYFDKIINKDLKIIKNFDSRNKKYMYYYRMQRVPITALFEKGFGAGKGSQNKQVPFFIYNSEEKIKKAFLDGYLTGDGCKNKEKRYITKFERFSTKSHDLAIGLQYLFKSLPSSNNFYGKRIEHVYWKYRKDKPNIIDLRLQGVKSKKDEHNNYCTTRIKNIQKKRLKGFVYDLEIEGCHNFVDAEGLILVHNTDSVFLLMKDKQREAAEEFLETTNSELPGLMELEFEGFYPTGIFVSAKMGEYGAKKKYALLGENKELVIKGFETVRRNWSPIAKETQRKVIEIILKTKKAERALDYVRDVIDALKHNKIPVEQVILHTQLQKPVEEYETISPHVAAAKLMKEKGIEVGAGSMIKFIVGKGGGRIRDKIKLPEDIKQEDYDSEYYINNQVIPSVEKLFSVLGYTKDDFLGQKQSTLGSFVK